jgi:hypothetical protein
LAQPDKIEVIFATDQDLVTLQMDRENVTMNQGRSMSATLSIGMVHDMHQSFGPSPFFCQSGAPHAPIFLFFVSWKAEMVYYVYHSSRFCVGCRPKWCTTCTIVWVSPSHEDYNGAPHAPFFRFSGLITVRMVHWMHQLLWFSG